MAAGLDGSAFCRLSAKQDIDRSLGELEGCLQGIALELGRRGKPVLIIHENDFWAAIGER